MITYTEYSEAVSLDEMEHPVYYYIWRFYALILISIFDSPVPKIRRFWDIPIYIYNELIHKTFVFDITR